MKVKNQKTRISRLLKRMNSGEDAAQRDLKNALSAEQFHSLQNAWANEKVRRDEFKEKPAAIKEYEALLKRAILLDNRAGGYSSKQDPKIKKSALNLRNQAETVLEIAWERLSELLSADPLLRIWLDREVDLGKPEAAPCLSIIDFLRVVTSRSLDNLGTLQKSKIRDLKINALTDALAELEAEEANAKLGISKSEAAIMQQAAVTANMKRIKKLLSKNQ